MPRKTNDTREEESLVAEVVNQSLLQIMGVPQLFAGVARKANIGNFETIDVYSAIGIPMGVTVGDLNAETLRQISMEAAELGFGIVSEETFSRYSLIKEMQAGKK